MSKNIYKVSRMFADALFSSLDNDELSDVGEALTKICELDLARMEEAHYFGASFSKEIEHKKLAVFMDTLSEAKSLKILPQVSIFFNERLDRHLGRKRVIVYLADMSSQEVVRSTLARSGKFFIDFVEDKSLLTGFKVYFVNEHKVLDMSIKGMLNKV